MKFVVKECLSTGFVSLLRGCGQPWRRLVRQLAIRFFPGTIWRG